MEYYSAIKKKENNAIFNNMDELGGHYDKWNKSDKYCMISLICGIEKLQQTNEYNKKVADSQI